jgi:hypothetical protein
VILINLTEYLMSILGFCVLISSYVCVAIILIAGWSNANVITITLDSSRESLTEKILLILSIPCIVYFMREWFSYKSAEMKQE